MSKKVLIVEQSLAVRGVAESLLRQNGFEAVTADSAAQAKEILGSSAINLILLSSEMTDESGQPLYESLGVDSATTSIPLLVLHDQNIETAPAYPPESVVSKPFTPREFLSAIGPFLGKADGDPGDESSPFSGADFEEDLIDTALGLDKIDVDDAEVLEDDTGVYRKTKRKSTTESMIGYDFKVITDDTGKIVHKKFDSVTVPADDGKTPPKPKTPEGKKPEENDSGELEIANKEKPVADTLSESSRLEISTDQYGLVAESTDDEQLVDDAKAHDYEWFLNELRKETDEGKGADISESSGNELPPSIPPEHQVSLDSPSEGSTIGPSAKQRPQPKKEEPEQPPATSTAHGEAIDKFISEFKKEVDKITGEEAEKIDVTTVAADETPPGSGGKSEGDLEWVNGLEKLPPDRMREISREIVGAVARQVAEQIIARIDPDVVYHLIKAAVGAYLDMKKEEHSRQPS